MPRPCPIQGATSMPRLTRASVAWREPSEPPSSMGRPGAAAGTRGFDLAGLVASSVQRVRRLRGVAARAATGRAIRRRRVRASAGHGAPPPLDGMQQDLRHGPRRRLRWARCARRVTVRPSSGTEKARSSTRNCGCPLIQARSTVSRPRRRRPMRSNAAPSEETSMSIARGRSGADGTREQGHARHRAPAGVSVKVAAPPGGSSTRVVTSPSPAGPATTSDRRSARANGGTKSAYTTPGGASAA